MKFPRWFYALILFLITGVAFSAWRLGRGVRVTETGADLFRLGFQGRHLDGSEFTLSPDDRKLVIINFWASWCEPCTREFPSFLKLADKMPDQLTLVAVAEDSQKDDVSKFLNVFDGRRPNIEIVWDPSGQIARSFGTDQFPESYIFNKKRHLAKKVVGMTDWSSDEVIDYMRHLASEP